MRLYIDTRGHSKGLWRRAPEGARFAAYTDRGSVEFTVLPDGSWYVTEGPAGGKGGGYRQVARGQHGEPPTVPPPTT